MPQTDVQLDRIIETFEFLDDWEERFAYLIDLGKKLAPMDPADKNDANRVHGCQATVWLKPQITNDDPPRFEFSAESDAFIVNGLIAILLSAYNGRTPREVADYDAEGLLKRLGLEEHLSPTRRNGLHSMIGRIRELASHAANGTKEQST
ncbi:MAG: SufE family protein [Phycisphaerales bacterium]|nr:MAG: SufE family protein [Phycisphaerales bacterium]